MIPVKPWLQRPAALIIAGAFLTAALSFPVALQRSLQEQRQKSVAIAVDWLDIREACRRERSTVPVMLAQARAAGVTTVALSEDTLLTAQRAGAVRFASGNDIARRAAIARGLSPASRAYALVVADSSTADALRALWRDRYAVQSQAWRVEDGIMLVPVFFADIVPPFWHDELPLGFSPSALRQIAEAGMSAVLKPASDGAVAWLAVPLQHNAVEGLWWEGKEISGFPGSEQDLIDLVKQRRIAYIDQEFTAVAGMARLRGAVPHAQVLGHAIPRPELQKYRSPTAWVDRWMRAVAERGVRLVGVWFTEQYTVNEHFAAVASLARHLQQRGFAVTGVRPAFYPEPAGRNLRVLAVMIVALCFPVAGIAAAVRVRAPWLVQFFLATAITAAGAGAVSALLYDAVFMQKLLPVPGIKLLLLVPLAVMPVVLYRPEEIVSFLSRAVKVWHIIAGMLIAAVVVVLLLRAGNSGLPVPAAESWMRGLLEQLMAVRPRTKEFLIGHPLLITGFAVHKRWLVWLGAIGQVSLMNTFLHAHTPLSISVLRTLYGLALGLALAAALLLVVRLCRATRWGAAA